MKESRNDGRMARCVDGLLLDQRNGIGARDLKEWLSEGSPRSVLCARIFKAYS